MLKTCLKSIFLLHCMLVSSWSLAKSSDSVESILESYRTVFDESLKSVDQEWILSTINKINGRWRANHSRWLTGEMRRQTFEIDRISIDELVGKLQGFANEQDWRVEFECHSFSCGRSYAWATEILDNKLLHGADKHQHYWVWRDSERWLSVYLVERANKKLYLQFMVMTPDSAKQEALIDQWNAQGYALIHSSNDLLKQSFSQDQLLRMAAEWAVQQNIKAVAVVGHTQETGQSMKALEAKALTLAESTAQSLKELAPDLIIKVYGLGPLAPRHKLSSRVEIVPITP